MNLDRARRLDGLLRPVCAGLGQLRRFTGAPPARAVVAAEPLPVHRGDLVVIKLVGLGSLALLAPGLFAWQRATQRRVILVTEAANHPLTDLLDPAIETLHLAAGAGLAGVAPLLRALRPLRPAVLDLEFYSAATTLLGSVVRPALQAGLAAPWRQRLLSHALPWPEGQHFAELAGLALAQLARQPLAATARLPLAPGTLPPAPPRLPGERYRVVVNPATGPLCPERRLPARLLAELVDHLAGDEGVQIHLVGAAGDREVADELLRFTACRDAVIDHVGRLDLAGLLALCGTAQLVISSDSGPLHLAAGMGAPTLSFFGPETPARFGPRGEQHTVVVGQVPCGPCLTAANQKRAPCRGRNLCLQQLDPTLLATLARRRLRGEERGNRDVILSALDHTNSS